jgi:hypothetical protein
MLLLQGSAFAVHDLGLFELDGNAQNDPTVAGDDWDSLPGSSIAFTGIVADGDSPIDQTFFNQGGSKDTNDVSEWVWSAGDNSPDKDELLDAYAAAYVDQGDLIVYFGADRFAQNGASQLGFWFFQNPVTLNPDGSFDGVHAINDILILSDFTTGGRIATIKVFRWVGGPDGIELVFPTTTMPVDCSLVAAGDDLCAIVNGSGIPAPWPYTPKQGPSGTIPAGGFYEGGINVSELVPGAECFASFLAETRSSPSVDAQLKDFVLANFQPCAPSTSLTKSASPTIIHSGESVTYTYRETNDGDGPLTSVTVTDDSCSPVVFQGGDTNGDGVLDVGETWTFTCTTTLTGAGTVTNTAIADAIDPRTGKHVTFCAEGTSPENTVCDPDERAQASVQIINPGTALTKSASATVTYTYAETNDGDTPLTNAFVSDDGCAPVTFTGGDGNGNGVLDPGETWTFQCTATVGPGQDVTNTAIGHGTDPTGADVTFCTAPEAGKFCDPDERDQVRVLIELR